MSEVMDWAAMLLRWGHVMAGVAWIGTSFYFNWFDLSVRPATGPVTKNGVRGTLEEVHGGSFYYHEQYWPENAPERLLAHSGPAQLTFITGLGLFSLLYWYGANVYLIDSQVARISAGHAILLSAGSLCMAWPLYDKLCRSVLSDRIVFVWVALAVIAASWLFTHLFGGRAAFVQIGVMMGAMMVGNVHFKIVPSHKEMVRSVIVGGEIDKSAGARAKRASQHNNYFTLPVIFCMLSIHFPLATAHPYNWLILVLMMGFGVTLRHWRNVAFKEDYSDRRLLAAAIGALALAIGISLSTRFMSTGVEEVAAMVSADEALGIVHARCATCHSRNPTDENFSAAPLGVHLDTMEQVQALSSKIMQRAVRSRDMPLNNVTKMTDHERAKLEVFLKHIGKQ